MNIKNGIYILTLLAALNHLPCFAIPIDQNQIRIHKKNLVDITCSSLSHHCVSLGMTAIEERFDYLIYLSDNDGETWDRTAELPKPPAKTSDTENNNRLGIHCDESGNNCILIGTIYIDKNRNIITYHSKDGGMHWNITNLIALPKRDNVVQSENSIDPEVLFACGQDNTHCIIATYTLSKHPKPLVYTTQDGGYAWANPLEIKIADLDPYYENLDLTDINCSQSGLNCIFMGEYRTTHLDNDKLITQYTQKTFTTQDGGITWDPDGYYMSVDSSNTQTNIPDQLLKISCDRSGIKCVALGSGEYQIIKQIQNENYSEENSRAVPYAYLSVDGGKTWLRTGKISQDPYMFPLVSLSCDNEAESCIAAGLKKYPEDEDKSDAIAFITYDSGYNWQPLLIQPSEKNSFFTKVFCDNASAICHIVGLDEKYF